MATNDSTYRGRTGLRIDPGILGHSGLACRAVGYPGSTRYGLVRLVRVARDFEVVPSLRRLVDVQHASRGVVDELQASLRRHDEHAFAHPVEDRFHPRPMNRPGFLLVIEGIDGAGKSTLQRGLAAWCREGGRTVLTSREPTDGPHGRALRESARTGRLSIDAELDLFLKDRREHVDTLIAPALAPRPTSNPTANRVSSAPSS